MENLKLYYMLMCPFCRRVMDYMGQNNMLIPLVDINEGKNRQQLIDIGGKAQVPCLVIAGKALYESADIIDWLKNNWREK